MTLITSDAEVLFADYGYHSKPFSTQQNKRNNFLFRLQIEGYCYALVEQKMVQINPGDLLIYAPGDDYMLYTAEVGINKETVPSGDYYLFCEGEWLSNWWQNSPKPTKLSIGLDETVITIWKQIIAEKRRLKDEVKEISGYLLKALCLAFDRNPSVNTSHNPDDKLATAYRIRHFIERNATSGFKLEDIAKQVNLSVSRVVHLFKATFGQTIIEYTVEVRLAIACEQIRLTDYSLELIAQQSGFQSYGYFHRVFRHHYKISPREYRKTRQIQHA